METTEQPKRAVPIVESESVGGDRMLCIQRAKSRVWLDRTELEALKAHLADEILAENKHRLVFQ